MAKFFVISDVHGYYNEMKVALDEAGFDPNNKEHWLISCGDHFDRGSEPGKVMDYLSDLERKVLIKGNHESLLLECLQRGYPYGYDWSNGTAQTVIDLASEEADFKKACEVSYHKVKDFLCNMVDYYETKNYIFVHAFVPLINENLIPLYYALADRLKVNSDWRNAHYLDWEDARWGNPFEFAEKGLLPDKTLIFGHFHTSWPRAKYKGEPEFTDEADFSPYHGDGYIGIDACTAFSGKVNILVLEDDFLQEV